MASSIREAFIPVLPELQLRNEARREALRADRRAARAQAREAGKAKEAARAAKRSDRRAARQQAAKQAATYNNHLLLEEEVDNAKWWEASSHRKAGLTRWERIAIKAVEDRKRWSRPERSEAELYAWRRQALAAIRRQYQLCKAGLGRCSDNCLQRAAWAGAPLAHQMRNWGSRGQESVLLGLAYRLTDGKLKSMEGLSMALADIVDVSPGIGPKSARTWFTRKSVWTVIRLSRLCRKHGDLPMAIRRRLLQTRIPAWAYANAVEKFHRKEISRNQFWGEVAETLKKGKTAALRQLGPDYQVGNLAPKEDFREMREVAHSLRLEPEARFRFLRGLPWGVYAQVRDKIQEALNSQGESGRHLALNAVSMAVAVTSTFGRQAARWLGEARGRELHDRVQWLPVSHDQSGQPGIPGLADALIRFRTKEVSDLKVLARSWAYLTEEQRKSSWERIMEACTATKLMQVPGAEELAFLCGKAGYDLVSYKEVEGRWLKSLETPSVFEVHQGKTWESGKVRGSFLARSDARGVMLGELTDCCQHPRGAGAACAWHGQESETGGFFVWETDRQVIAQAWVWLSTQGNVVFDNIEALGKAQSSYRGDILSVLNEVAQYLGGTVTLGTGYDRGFASAYPAASGEDVQFPSGYSGYRDSQQQVVVRK